MVTTAPPPPARTASSARKAYRSAVDFTPVEQEDAPPTDSAGDAIISIKNLNFCYGAKQALHGINLEIGRQKVTAFIGPSGCGKSTLLRCINRINDRIHGARVTGGTVHVKGKNIQDADVDLTQLRQQVGMVFQKYNPFPKSIFENVAFGLRIHHPLKRSELSDAVEQALRQSALWEELKDRLHKPAMGLSGGQMQRLCIARAIATRPDILLMDEPCSALDPIASGKIEDLISQLVENYTVVIVTHNMQQARRVADQTAFFYLGKLIECAPTMDLFNHPREAQTEAYVRGQFS